MEVKTPFKCLSSNSVSLQCIDEADRVKNVFDTLIRYGLVPVKCVNSEHQNIPSSDHLYHLLLHYCDSIYRVNALRTVIGQVMRGQAKYYKLVLSELLAYRGVNYDSYVKYIESPGSPCDEIGLLVVSEILQLEICVFLKDKLWFTHDTEAGIAGCSIFLVFQGGDQFTLGLSPAKVTDKKSKIAQSISTHGLKYSDFVRVKLTNAQRRQVSALVKNTKNPQERSSVEVDGEVVPCIAQQVVLTRTNDELNVAVSMVELQSSADGDIVQIPSVFNVENVNTDYHNDYWYYVKGLVPPGKEKWSPADRDADSKEIYENVAQIKRRILEVHFNYQPPSANLEEEVPDYDRPLDLSIKKETLETEHPDMYFEDTEFPNFTADEESSYDTDIEVLQNDYTVHISDDEYVQESDVDIDFAVDSTVPDCEFTAISDEESESVPNLFEPDTAGDYESQNKPTVGNSAETPSVSRNDKEKGVFVNKTHVDKDQANNLIATQQNSGTFQQEIDLGGKLTQNTDHDNQEPQPKIVEHASDGSQEVAPRKNIPEYTSMKQFHTKPVSQKYNQQCSGKQDREENVDVHGDDIEPPHKKPRRSKRLENTGIAGKKSESAIKSSRAEKSGSGKKPYVGDISDGANKSSKQGKSAPVKSSRAKSSKPTEESKAASAPVKSSRAKCNKPTDENQSASGKKSSKGQVFPEQTHGIKRRTKVPPILKCKFCRRTFDSYSKRTDHYTNYHKVEFMCKPECGKTFASKAALYKHKRTHTKKNFKHRCDVCKKKFMYKHQLRVHEGSHEDSKFYTCPSKGCSKSFSAKTDYTRHIQVHAKSVYYYCSRCNDYRDRDPKLVHEHILQGHAPKDQYKCNDCDFECQRRNKMNRHTKKHGHTYTRRVWYEQKDELPTGPLSDDEEEN